MGRHRKTGCVLCQLTSIRKRASDPKTSSAAETGSCSIDADVYIMYGMCLISCPCLVVLT